jgi:CDP-paratose 2-epimerase
MNRVLITGSSGLIGSEAVLHYDRLGAEVHGIGNNMRMQFFGERGDTRWNVARLLNETQRFQHYEIDIRDRASLFALFKCYKFDPIVHCAAQPSHDKAREIPLDDFDVNAVGTINLLEATRRNASEAVFIFMSTNKVYGDAPNEVRLVETETRWEYADPAQYNGIDEECGIDQCLHSVFGASKVAADVMTQEYGRYYGMKTGSFRGGCLTGPNHAGVELHGFLNYLVKVAVSGGNYTVFGYKGNKCVIRFTVSMSLRRSTRSRRIRGREKCTISAVVARTASQS